MKNLNDFKFGTFSEWRRGKHDSERVVSEEKEEERGKKKKKTGGTFVAAKLISRL